MPNRDAFFLAHWRERMEAAEVLAAGTRVIKWCRAYL